VHFSVCQHQERVWIISSYKSKSIDRFCRSILHMKELGTLTILWRLWALIDAHFLILWLSFITSLRAENRCSGTTKDMTRLYRCRTTRSSIGCLYLSRYGLLLCLYVCTSTERKQCVESIIKHDAQEHDLERALFG
jgi:hypothetical protein